MRRATAGFTLIELIVAMLLSGVVLAGLASILTPLVQAQFYSAQSQTIQLNLAAVQHIVERELRQANMITQPAGAGVPSGTLEGCQNASGKPPARLDPGAPMRWFAVCTINGIVYYHTGAGCPAAYACGTNPAAAFIWGKEPWSALTFTRPSQASTLITMDLKAATGKISDEVEGAVAFAAPTGPTP